VLHRLAHGENYAETSRFGAPKRTAATNRLTGNHAGGVLPGDARILIHHPAHHLGGGANVRRGYVLARTDVAVHSAHISPAQAFFFRDRKRGGVHHNAALAAAQGDIGDSAFPGHPHGKRPHGVGSFRRVKAQTAFVRPAGVVVLHAVGFEHPDFPVIHTHWQAHMEFAGRPAQNLTNLLIQPKLVGNFVKLLLCHLKCIGLS